MNNNNSLRELAQSVIDAASMKNVQLITAESCTGGLMGAALTEIAGASQVYQGGVVTYSNELKQKLLGVSNRLLSDYGAVSQPVAEAMATAILQRSALSSSALAIAFTGIAGPGGGTAEKPVGLVHIAIADPHQIQHHKACYFGENLSRHEIREQAVCYGLQQLHLLLQ